MEIIATAAIMGSVSPKISTNKLITNDVIGLERIGSALKMDNYHNYSNLVDNYAVYATKTILKRGAIYQLNGNLNGVDGRFEWIVNNNKVTHRMFVKGGGINGIPIMP